MLGVIPKARVLGIVTNDLLVHTWDLARAIGGDERLDAGAVAACYEVVAAIPRNRPGAEGVRRAH